MADYVILENGEIENVEGGLFDTRPSVAQKTKQYEEKYSETADDYFNTTEREFVDVPGTSSPEGVPDTLGTYTDTTPNLKGVASDVYSAASKLGGGGAYLAGKATGSEDLQNLGDDMIAKGQAWQNVASEKGDYLGPAAGFGAMAAMPLARTLKSSMFAGGVQGVTFGAGEGQDVEGSLASGAIDASAVGLIGKLIGAGGKINVNDLEKFGIDAFDKKLLTSNKDLIKRIEATTGKPVNELLTNAAEHMKSLGKTELTEEEVVRLAVQNAAGGENFSPRASKYLMGAESTDSTVGPKVMAEAQARTEDIRGAVANNPELADMVESFTTKNGNFEATDWHGLQQGLKDFGMPEGGPVMKRIAANSNLDDTGMLRGMQGANPTSGGRLSAVGQRGDWKSQAEAEYMDKIRRFVLDKLPYFHKDQKIQSAILKSLKEPGLTPMKLTKALTDAGVPAAKVTDDMIDEAMNLATEKFPESGAGTAGGAKNPERAIPLIDEAELNTRLDGKKLPTNAERDATTNAERYSIPKIIEEFKGAGEGLDEALQAGMDIGLSGGKLRNFIKLKLDGMPGKSSSLQSHPQVGGATVGATAGIEENEDGSLGYDPLKGAVGAVAGATIASKGFRNKVLGKEGLNAQGMRPAHLGGTPLKNVYNKFKSVTGSGPLTEALDAASSKGLADEDRITNFVEGYLGVSAKKTLAKVNDDFLINDKAIEGLNSLQGAIDAGKIPDSAMFYGDASELYLPTNSNKVKDAIWDQDPKVLKKIEDFTRDEGGAVERATRGGEGDLDRLFTYPENFEGTVYRGSRLKGSAQKQIFDALKPGDILSNDSLISTSTSPGVAREFMEEPKNAVIKNKMGYSQDKIRYPLSITIKGKGHDIAKQSSIDTEEEVIMNKNKWFNVLDRQEKGSINHLLLEELGPDAIRLLQSKGIKPNTEVLKLLGIAGGMGAISQEDY